MKHKRTFLLALLIAMPLYSFADDSAADQAICTNLDQFDKEHPGLNSTEITVHYTDYAKHNNDYTPTQQPPYTFLYTPSDCVNDLNQNLNLPPNDYFSFRVMLYNDPLVISPTIEPTSE